MSHLESIPSAIVVKEETPQDKGWRKFLKRVGNWFSYKDKGEWLKNMRESLSLMASIIATMTFQLATNPPGSILQTNHNEVANIKDCLKSNNPCPGEAVLAIVYEDFYLKFLICNNISFVASLSVCLSLVSGIPLNHRFPIWFLSISLCITITSLALTYLYAASMVTPDPIWNQTTSMFNKVLKIWISLLGIVGSFFMVRLFVRGGNKLIWKCNRPQQ